MPMPYRLTRRDKKAGTALVSSLYHTCMNIWVITVGGGGAKAVENRRADVPPLHLQTRMDTDHEHRLFQKCRICSTGPSLLPFLHMHACSPQTVARCVGSVLSEVDI